MTTDETPSADEDCEMGLKALEKWVEIILSNYYFQNQE